MTFSDAYAFTLARELGEYDGSQPRDPNRTKDGVTQATYTRFRTMVWHMVDADVYQMTDAERETIYRSYWDAASCDALGKLSGMTAFEQAFNAGPTHAIQAVQRAVGVNDDGVMGAQTKAAIARWTDADLAQAICWQRLKYYADVAHDPVKRPNLLSWLNRVLIFKQSFI